MFRVSNFNFILLYLFVQIVFWSNRNKKHKWSKLIKAPSRQRGLHLGHSSSSSSGRWASSPGSSCLTFRWPPTSALTLSSLWTSCSRVSLRDRLSLARRFWNQIWDKQEFEPQVSSGESELPFILFQSNVQLKVKTADPDLDPVLVQVQLSRQLLPQLDTWVTVHLKHRLQGAQLRETIRLWRHRLNH